MSYDSGGLLNTSDVHWEAPPKPVIGSSRWKDDMAFSFAVEHNLLHKSQVIKLPTVKGYDLGFFVIRYISGSGTDYFRVDSLRDYTDIIGEIK